MALVFLVKWYEMKNSFAKMRNVDVLLTAQLKLTPGGNRDAEFAAQQLAAVKAFKELLARGVDHYDARRAVDLVGGGWLGEKYSADREGATKFACSLVAEPLAVPGLESYRYRGIMIGAKNDDEALKEAARSTVGEVSRGNLEVWRGKYVPV